MDGIPFCQVSETHLEQASRNRSRFPTLKIAWCVLRLFPGITRDMQMAAFDFAFQNWCDVSQLTHRNIADPRELLEDEALVLIDSRRIDGPGMVLAESELADGTLRPVRQWYDSERFVLTDRPTGNQIDLGAVACHELGHAVGISHLSTGALMAPHYVPGLRTPQREDIEEIQVRYGKPSPSAPPPAGGLPSVTVLEIDWGARVVREKNR